MSHRYPYLRLLIDAGPVIAPGAALLIFLGATLRACEAGVPGSVIGSLLAAVAAVVVYVLVRAHIELLQVWLDMAENAERRGRPRAEPQGEATDR